jgi:hypothetical protein
MTIAIGIVSPFGTILASDSQEGTGYAGDMKLSTSKIMAQSHGNVDQVTGQFFLRSCAITGAGDSGYLNAIKQKISRTFDQDPQISIDGFETYLENELIDFYDKHICPFSGNQLDIKLIVAAQVQQDRRMWVTHMNSVRRVEAYAAVGSGESWAKSALKGFFPSMTNEHATTIIATYATFMAKEYAEGCGKQTQMILLPVSGGLKFPLDDAIDTLEAYFTRYNEAERIERWRTMGQGFGVPRKFDEFLETMQSDLAKMQLYPGLPPWAKPQDE